MSRIEFGWDGNTLIVIPVMPGLAVKRIEMNKDEIVAFHNWIRGGLLIQEAFPNWSAGKREILISGMNDEEFDLMFK